MSAEARSVLDEAKAVVLERQTRYGTREQNFTRIARLWSVILDTEVSAEQVALCMIAVKIAREMYLPSRDNRVDLCGYAHCLDELAQQMEGDLEDLRAIDPMEPQRIKSSFERMP